MLSLAFDLGTNFGWVAFDDRPKYFGALHLDASKNLADNHLAILELVKTYAPIKCIYYEETDWHRGGWPGEGFQQRLMREKINRQVQRSLGRLEALIVAVAYETNTIALPVTVKEAKGSLSKNNAGKEKIARAVLALYPELDGCSQDTLDAASVMHAAVNKEIPLFALDGKKRKKKS
jgi:hypothetical protein